MMVGKGRAGRRAERAVRRAAPELLRVLQRVRRHLLCDAIRREVVGRPECHCWVCQDARAIDAVLRAALPVGPGGGAPAPGGAGGGGQLLAVVAANIRRLRAARGLPQRTLAGRAGVSTSYVSMLERGHRGVPLPTLERVAKALRVNPLALLR